MRWIAVGEPGDAVQRHGRLARAGRAADHDEARGRLGDQLELLGIDETRDVGQALVGAAAVALEIGAEPALVALADGVSAQRRALAAGEAVLFARLANPALAVVLAEDALGSIDADELSGLDRDSAPGDHLAFAHAPAELLFVHVTLLVAVEQLGDGRVAPVDDAHAALDAGGLAEADVAAGAVLLDADVGEVRRLGVDLGSGARFAELLEQRELPVVLLHDRAFVLLLGVGEVFAQSHELLDDGLLGGRYHIGHLLQERRNLVEQLELVSYDRVGHGVGSAADSQDR